MPVDPSLVDRIRDLVAADGRPGWSEGRMFGGVAFLLDGHMTTCASTHGGILVRVAPDATERLLATTPATPMVMRGRELSGWVRVADEDVRTRRQLATWFRRSVAVAETLPRKPAKPPGHRGGRDGAGRSTAGDRSAP